MPGEESFAGSSASFIAGDGLRLTWRRWCAPEPRATIRIIHGLGEHGGRYADTARRFQQAGFTTRALDLRGHGASEGERGHVNRFDDYLDDVDAFVRESAAPGPSILLGHSLGGLIALRAVQAGHAGQPAGLVLSAPALALVPRSGAWRTALADLLVRVAPRAPFTSGIDGTDLTDDPVEIAAYRNDPLVHDRITPRLFVEMRMAMKAAAAAASTVHLPVLLLAPERDPVTNVAVAVDVASNFTGDVTVRPCPGSLHEPLTGIERDRVRDDIVRWVTDRLS